MELHHNKFSMEQEIKLTVKVDFSNVDQAIKGLIEKGMIERAEDFRDFAEERFQEMLDSMIEEMEVDEKDEIVHVSAKAEVC